MSQNRFARRFDFLATPIQLGMVLSLGLGLTLALLWLVGGAGIQIAQASPPARPLFAPMPMGTDPISNALNVPVTSNVSITFDEPISLTSATSRTFALYGSQSPIFTGTYALSNLSRTVTLDPDRNFFPGERVDATVTTATLNITGEQAISATVWQFWAAVGVGNEMGSGVYVAHPVSPTFDGGYSTHTSLGDLDGDGDLDAVVANFANQPETVWLNDGTGGFAPHPTQPSFGISYTLAVALGDIDGDGDLDAVVANSSLGGDETVWLNDGTGAFAPHPTKPSFDAGYAPDVALGDVDADGDLDAVFLDMVSSEETVWLNDGTGVFNATSTYFGVGDDNTALALGDLDGDNDLDVVITVYSDTAQTVWLNDGTGSFTAHSTTPNFGSEDSKDVALGDIDADGDLDALVANFAQSQTVWLNDGTGAFTAHPTTPGFGGGDSEAIALGDLDGDGDLDAVVANYNAQTQTTWLNDGGGNFTPHPTTPVFGANNSRHVALGDLDGDGDLDVVISNYNEQNIVYLNQNQADLFITKIADPEPAVAGLPLTYTLFITNQGDLAAGNVTLTDTLHPSTTLQTISQTDDDAQDFGAGVHNNTRWNDPRPGTTADEWLEIEDTLLSTGVYTSHTFDASNVVSWTTLSWRPRRPYWKALPDNGGTEWGYTFGEADMTGNRLLLHLDETAGATSFSDTSGRGNDGTCPAVAGEGCPTAGANGRFNEALSFTGASSQTVVITDTVDPVRYALELWVYPTVVTDTSFILRTDTPTDTAQSYSHLLGIADGHFLHAVYDGSYRAITGTTAVQADTWYHVVGTAESGGDIKLFVNGVEETRLDGVGTLWTGGDWYRLGASYGPTGTTQCFSGRLDEVAVYSRTLSSGEVLDHYLRGALRLSFDVRSCDDAACVGEGFGGPYSEQSHTGLGWPSVALSGVPDNRYFQYRATLETDEADYSPELRSVTVGPNHYAVYASQGGCAAVAGAFTCTLGTVAGGGVVTVTAYANVHPSALDVITNTAAVTTSLDTNPADNSTIVTSTVSSQADLRIGKYDDEYGYGGTDPVNPGSLMTYTLIVHNAGPSTAWDVTVTDTLPITVTGVSAPGGWDPCQFTTHTITCTVGSLLPHTWPRIVITGTAPTAIGIITNTAWITASNEVSPTNNSGSETTSVEPLADLSIAKAASPDPVNPGETLTFVITVTNNGPSAAVNVTVTDTLQAGLTAYPIGGNWSCSNQTANVVVCTLASLADGASDSFQITTTAPLSGTVANWAVVTSDTTDPDDEDNLVYAYVAIRPVADLSISKTDTPDPVDAGAPLTYTLTITNAGYVPAGAVEATLALTNGANIHIPYGGRARPYPSALYLSGAVGQVRNMTVTLNSLSHTYPGDLEVLLVGPNGANAVLMANAGGGADVSGLTLTFNDAGLSMPVSDTLTSTVIYRPTNHGLTGDLADPAPDGPYGGSLSAFNNASPNGLWRLYFYDTFGSDGGDIAGGWSLYITTMTTDTVTLSDTLPAGLTGVGVSAPSADWTCFVVGDAVTCEADTFAVGVPAVFTITASAPITGGIITNTAAITSTTADFWPDDNTVTITTTVTSVADLAIAKTANASQVEAGAPLTYTLTISNIGPSPLLNTVMVTDLLHADLTGVSVSGTGWACDTSALPLVTCTVGSLAVGPAPDIVIAATAPITTGVITNTAGVTATVSDPDLLNNSAVVTTTVDEMPIAGLAAFNDSPTALGNPTNLWATVTAGSNVTYVWNFGDTLTAPGNPVSHTYALTGTYTAVVTATNSRGFMTATTQVQVIEWYGLYLPLVMRNYAVAPDLVVDSVIATSNAVTVTIRNQGPAAVEDEFWVDVYIDPDTPPTQVNQTWQHVGSQGLVWGVTAAALPLQPGDVLTLTVNDAYYWPTESAVTWPLPAGTPVYAQVDSAHAATTYGGVMEDHEIIGGPYNNIIGPVSSTGVTGAALPPVEDGSRPDSTGSLPPR